MSKVTVSTDAGYRTNIQADGAFTETWHADEPEDRGGTNLGPNPEAMLLGALGSCTTITLHMYANRKGWPLERVEIELEIEKFKASEYEGYEGDAKFVHEIVQRLAFTGDLDESQHARLMEIAGKCPVHRILDGPTYIREQTLQQV